MAGMEVKAFARYTFPMNPSRLPDSSVPPSLLEIPQPPKELWIMGTLPDPSYICIAFVGSRAATTYGKDACERLIKGLASYPFCIVSGLALGIDTVAHKAALAAGLPTIAVPGSGLGRSVLYPRTNVQLAEEIVQKGGCLLSEFPPDFRATVWSFPQRNRIMAGLSQAVVIIEAQDKSGTLITARMALDYNRELLAVPGPISSPASRGTNRLIKQGAAPVTDAADILELFHIEPKTGAEAAEEALADCTSEERRVLALLAEPKSRDLLARESGMDISELNMALTLLEIKELIREEFGEIRRVV